VRATWNGRVKGSPDMKVCCQCAQLATHRACVRTALRDVQLDVRRKSAATDLDVLSVTSPELGGHERDDRRSTKRAVDEGANEVSERVEERDAREDREHQREPLLEELPRFVVRRRRHRSTRIHGVASSGRKGPPVAALEWRWITLQPTWPSLKPDYSAYLRR